MFNSLGLFGAIPCPEGAQCALLNCIFAHPDKATVPLAMPPAEIPQLTHPKSSSSSNNQPPLKRKRREADNEDETRPDTINGSPDVFPGRSKAQKLNNGRKEVHESARKIKSLVKQVSPPPTNNAQTPLKNNEAADSHPDNNKSASKACESGHLRPRQVKKESLNPRLLSKPPASHTTRMAILTKLHETMTQLNDLVRKAGDKKALILSKDEVVCMALDEEEKVAKESPSVYSNIVKQRIVKLKKMSTKEWSDEVMKFFWPNGVPTPEQTKAPESKVMTGLAPEEETTLLSKLISPISGLQGLGVVTTPPTSEEIDAAKAGAEAAQGWEKCDRCNGRFQVYPGRREDGLLAGGGACTYHYARPLRPAKQKTDHIVGHKESYYPCCNETVGTSAGCTKSETHVFKISEAKRLAAILQFQTTPRQPDKGSLPPVCFDCEMGYTTLGLELIRLTAVSWPEGRKILDILVRPIGEILDLNSRYSGVRPEHFANAIPYGSTPKKGQSKGQVLEVVDSPSIARSLLFRFLQPDTPLIGHSIENDLNACRIIHPTIIDTALLYPHPRGLPLRFGLRALTKQYLERTIQAGGGSEGHDSMEDARATGDLVRIKVRDLWNKLKREGYAIKDGKIVAVGQRRK